MAESKGMTHGEIIKIRHYEHQQKALEQIRDLRHKFSSEVPSDITTELDRILKELDDKTAP